MQCPRIAVQEYFKNSNIIFNRPGKMQVSTKFQTTTCMPLSLAMSSLPLDRSQSLLPSHIWAMCTATMPKVSRARCPFHPIARAPCLRQLSFGRNPFPFLTHPKSRLRHSYTSQRHGKASDKGMRYGRASTNGMRHGRASTNGMRHGKVSNNGMKEALLGSQKLKHDDQPSLGSVRYSGAYKVPTCGN